ncbi:MAG: hypothetical protein ACRC42_01995, partial [Mycoplasma sp.]
NKFQVSFGEFGKDAEKFSNKLPYSFNLSRQSLMDYIPKFNSMLKSFGSISSSDTIWNMHNINANGNRL